MRGHIQEYIVGSIASAPVDLRGVSAAVSSLWTAAIRPTD